MSKSGRLMKRVVVLTMALFLSASSFFYAPMEVSAEDNVISYTVSDEIISGSSTNGPLAAHFIDIDMLSSNLDSNVLYKIDGLYTLTLSSSEVFWFRNLIFNLNNKPVFSISGSDSSQNIHSFSGSLNLYLYGDSLTNLYGYLNARAFIKSNTDIVCSLEFSDLVFTPLTGEESASYESGYSAGESAGYESGYTAGESAGYSSGYETGYEQGESAGYDQGFQAGVDSVDTQSYYDAGYNAGYSAGYNVGYEEGYNLGYEEGYDQGYADCLARLQESGADTGEYPKTLIEWTLGSESSIVVNAKTIYPGTAFGSTTLMNTDLEFDPTHVYKIEFSFVDGGTDYDSYSASGFKRVLMLGSREYLFTGNSAYFYVDGQNMASDFVMGMYAYYARATDTEYTPYGQFEWWFSNLYFKVSDLGFKDDMQNITANQTDTLIHGFDDSGGTSMNDSFNTSINDYNIAEDSLFNAVNTGLDDFQFFDFESVPAMVTGITFVTSIMDSLFNAMGGASGAGIVLSVLFTIVIVSMALGLARFYQSDGRKGRKE